MKLMKKVAMATMLAGIVAQNALANVEFNAATKTFTGVFELNPYYSAVGVIIGAIAVVAAIGLALKQFRRVG